MAAKEADSLAFLKKVMGDVEVPIAQRVRAAIAAAQYEHVKAGDGGKKDAEAERARQAANAFAATSTPIRLVSGSR